MVELRNWTKTAHQTVSSHKLREKITSLSRVVWARHTSANELNVIRRVRKNNDKIRHNLSSCSQNNGVCALLRDLIKTGEDSDAAKEL